MSARPNTRLRKNTRQPAEDGQADRPHTEPRPVARKTTKPTGSTKLATEKRLQRVETQLTAITKLLTSQQKANATVPGWRITPDSSQRGTPQGPPLPCPFDWTTGTGNTPQLPAMPPQTRPTPRQPAHEQLLHVPRLDQVQVIGNPPQPLRHTEPPVPAPDQLVVESSAVGHIAAAIKQLDPTFTNTAGKAKTLKPSMFISKRLLGKKNDMDDLSFPLFTVLLA